MSETPAERELAYQLRSCQLRYEREAKIDLHGLKMLDYAKVDFLVEGKLIVEVDGPSHLDPKQKELDRKKDAALKQLKIPVLRVQNRQVFNGFAIGKIRRAVDH